MAHPGRRGAGHSSAGGIRTHRLTAPLRSNESRFAQRRRAVFTDYLTVAVNNSDYDSPASARIEVRGPGRSMMKLQCAFEAGRRRPWLSRPNGEGGGAVAFAAAAPLIVLAVAVAADHAHVSRFRTQVQLAAGAASLAAAGAIARHPEISATASAPGSPAPSSPGTPRAGRVERCRWRRPAPTPW